MTRRTYTGPIVDVSYDADICIHAAECVRGMPQVFNTAARPWIDPREAAASDEADQLRRVVGLCPSGALEIVEHPEG